jgi:hypothetical protein
MMASCQHSNEPLGSVKGEWILASQVKGSLSHGVKQLQSTAQNSK